MPLPAGEAEEAEFISA